MKTFGKKAIVCAMIAAMSAAAVSCGSSGDTSGSSSSTQTSSADSTSSKESDGSDTSEEGTASGEVTPAYLDYASEPTTLTWYINYSWFAKPNEASAVTKKIIEETGVTIDFVVPAGNESEKLNSMIASDTLPDLLTMGYWETQIGDMILDGYLMPLNELADEYDPYWWEVADSARVGWYTSSDGNCYQYPNSSLSPSDYEKYDNIPSNQTFLVRKDMYEALGSPDMTTPEGFISTIKAAAEMFPEVDGQALIPFGCHEFTATGCSSFEGYLQNYLAIPYETEDGQAYDRNLDPEYVRWLKAFRELGAEGYLSDDIFIDQRAQMEEKIAQGRYFSMLYQRTDMATQQKNLYQEDPDKIYLAVDGPKNSNGDDYRLTQTGIAGWTTTMISHNCKQPERAISLMSYLMSEHGNKLVRFGPEGVGYTEDANGIPTTIPEVRELLANDSATYSETIGGNNAYWMLQDSGMGFAWAEDPVPALKQMQEWTYPYVVSTSQYTYTLDASSEESTINLKVQNEWGSTLPKLLLASSEEEFDAIWDKWVEKKASLGYDKVLAEDSRQLAENKVKLGID